MIKIRFSKLIATAAVILVIYNELLTYSLLSISWTRSGVKECNNNCKKILVVADPQILGEQDSNHIARWDCDRYLQKTFSRALNYVEPDVVIFLGDIMDEGHIAGNNQYQMNLKRFQSIFDTSNIPMVCIPGDNDIGGEGDPILPHIVHRFDSTFDQSQDISIGNLEFYKVNKMTQMFQEPEVFNSNAIRIGLTHMPILRKIHTFSKKLATALKPHIIFSGHDHICEHVSAPLDNAWDKTVETIGPEMTGWLDYSLDSKIIHELIVPTCSYRMGVLNMGYGYVLIDEANKKMSVKILWLPKRLLHLFTYLGFLIFVIVCLVFIGSRRLLRFLHRILTRTCSRRTHRYFRIA